MTNEEFKKQVKETPLMALNYLGQLISDYYLENIDLKGKIKLAVEYIENNAEKTEQRLDFDKMKTYNVALLEVKDILKGSDKEWVIA